MSDGMSSPSEPESAGRSGGRSRAKPGAVVSSYAAIGLLKENMQAVVGRKPGDSKAPSERDITDDLSGTLKLSNLKTDLQQRTGPSRENALLRAELEVLRTAHQDLANRLALAEGKLGQHSRQLRHSHSGLQQELTSLKDALLSADAEKASALSVAEGAFSQIEAIHQMLEDLLLQPAEVEAAALQCCWLAHHWELALHFGLFPEVAAGRAAYWRALSPPTDAIIQSARHVTRLRQQQRDCLLVGPCSAAGPGTDNDIQGDPADLGPEWLRRGAGRFSSSMQASAADLIEIERGSRQLQELGVEAAVMAALAQQAAARRTTLQLPPASADGVGGGLLLPVVLSPEEACERQLAAAYLAYLWGRAALLGVEPQVSASRAEQWCWLLDQQSTVRDFQDIRQGYQELRMLSVEQQLWQKRHSQLSSKPLPAAKATAASPAAVTTPAATKLSAVPAATAAKPSENATLHCDVPSSPLTGSGELGGKLKLLVPPVPQAVQAAAEAVAAVSSHPACTVSLPVHSSVPAAESLPAAAAFSSAKAAGLRTG